MRGLIALAAIVAVLAPVPADAHGLTPGPIGIYFAFLHLLGEMPAPLALAAFGLLLGLSGRAAALWAWPVFLLAIVGGMAGILMWRVYIDPELPLLLLAFAAALWAASGLALPWYGAVVFGISMGYFIGVFITPAPASWSMQAYAIAGGLIAANVSVVAMFAIATAIRERFYPEWSVIAMRVVSSWLAAISALILALSMRR